MRNFIIFYVGLRCFYFNNNTNFLPQTYFLDFIRYLTIDLKGEKDLHDKSHLLKK
jgi:hypothetical protein